MTPLETFISAELGAGSSIGWFGLSADPPTIAHATIITEVLKSGLVQNVIVFPAGKLPYKTFLASREHRMKMTELWARSAKFPETVHVSFFDMQRKEAFTWINLLEHVTRLSPDLAHHFIIGGDQYQRMKSSWVRGEELFEKASFIIIPREGHGIDKPFSSRHHVLPISPLKSSSTQVRTGDLSMVQSEIAEYIKKHHLYGF